MQMTISKYNEIGHFDPFNMADPVAILHQENESPANGIVPCGAIRIEKIKGQSEVGLLFTSRTKSPNANE